MNRLSVFSYALVFVLSLSVSVLAADTPALLQDFNSHASPSSANRFLASLQEQGFFDEPIVMPANAERDSMREVVWYWAAEYFYDIQDFSSAAQYGEQAVPLCRRYSDKVMHADCASLLSLIYVRLGDFDRAAAYAKECNELDLLSGDPNNIASSYNTLAGIYMSMHQVNEAEKYILRAIDYVKKADNPAREAVIYGMASEVYQHKNMPHKTLDYATRAWEIETSLGRTDKAAVRQTQRAAALIVLEQYDEAEKCLQEAIPVIEASGNYHSLGIAYNHMGDLLYVTGRNKEGADYYYKALPIFQAQHDIYNEAHTRKGLRETLRGIDPQAALEHGDRFEHLRDSIYDRETNANLSHITAELENGILQQLNRRQRIQTVIIISLVCLLFLISAVVSYIIHLRRQRNQVQHFNSLLREVEQLRKQERMKLLIDGSADKEIPARTEEESDELFLARVVNYANSALPSGNLTIEGIANAMCMSPSTFRRRMIVATGGSPKVFIHAIQINKAKELLMMTPPPYGGSVYSIAVACGYKDTNTFIRAFQRATGMTPKNWKEQNKQQSPD